MTPNLDGLNRILLLFGPQPADVLDRYFAAGLRVDHAHRTSNGKTIGYALSREEQDTTSTSPLGGS